MAANTGQVCTFKRWRHSFKHLRSLFKHVLQFMQAWQQALPGLEVPLRLGV